MKTRWLACAVLGSGMFCVIAAAADWPQWRGPNRDGVSQEKGLLQEWPKEGPKLLWQVKDIGDGYATPAVVGKRLYLLSSRGLEDEYVQSLNVVDGKQAWSHADRQSGKSRPSRRSRWPAPRPRWMGNCSTPSAPMAIWPAWKRLAARCVGRRICRQLRRQARPVGVRRIAAGRWRRAGLHARRQRGYALGARIRRRAS